MAQGDINMLDDSMDEESQEPLVEEVQNDETEPMEGDGPIKAIEGPESKPEPNLMANEAAFTWRVPHFSRLTSAKLHSDDFFCGGTPWNILLFPRGNREVNGKAVSLYLNVADHESAPLGWSRHAKFNLSVTDHKEPDKSVSKDASHTFTASSVDWGFTTFLSLADIANQNNGYLVDDTLEIKARVVMDKTENALYDSKKETGFVGLKNQGATCYMNSLLQFLYNINFFRQAVYHMPTQEDDDAYKDASKNNPKEENAKKTIPLALQSLFYKLQFGESSVSTKELTKSFGWDTYDAFMQHDVQELNRVLQEKLEDKMKGTKVEGTIARLFEGHMHMFIECINVDYKSTRRESFMDLQLDVKGCKDIYGSFDKYCEVEVMDGQNQYQTDEHGMQDARKGVLFDSFPPVLQLQLKRFEYDFQRDVMVKINDRYEFPDELDLDVEDGKWLSENADRSVRNLYKLHSVLVHSGGVHGGHYYAYIQPDGKRWLKFDDERVSEEDAKKALNEQYGGEDATTPGGGLNTFKFTKYSNAYMLVYVRKSDWDQIMCPVTDEDIQEHVRLRLEAEKKEKEERKREKAEAHLYTVIRLVRDSDIAEQIGNGRWFDLANPDKVKPERVKKETTYGELKRKLAEELGVDPARQRFWTFAKRQNSTVRPARPLSEDEDAQKVDSIKDSPGGPLSGGRNLGGPGPLVLYHEVSPDKDLPQVDKNCLLLFIKFYDPKTENLKYIGHIIAPAGITYGALTPLLKNRAGLPENAELDVYEEIKYEPTVMCQRQRMQDTLMNAQLEHGDILCIQEMVHPEEAKQYRYPTVDLFLAWVRARISVSFRRLDQPKGPGIDMELSKDSTYDEVCAALTERLRQEGQAEALGLEDPQQLRFTGQQSWTATIPKSQPFKHHAWDALYQAMHHYGQALEVLFYEVLDMPLREYEQLKHMKVPYHATSTAPLSTHDVRLPKESTVGDLLDALMQQLPADKRPKELRLLEIFNGKIYQIFTRSHKLSDINDDYWDVRAEPVPEEEMNPSATSRTIHVYHIAPGPGPGAASPFGQPFLFQIEDDETLEDVKPRIKTKLGVPDNQFAKWKFAFVANLRAPEYLEDDEILASRFARQGTPVSQDTSYLGLEHVDTGPKQAHRKASTYSAYERPVKIWG